MVNVVKLVSREECIMAFSRDVDYKPGKVPGQWKEGI